MKRKDEMGFPVPLYLWSKNKGKDFIMDVLLSKKAKERNINGRSRKRTDREIFFN